MGEGGDFKEKQTEGEAGLWWCSGYEGDKSGHDGSEDFVLKVI